MKIAFVVHDFLNGTGHGRYCIELARIFSREHEVHVLANRFERDLDFKYTQRFIPAWRISALTSVLIFPSVAQRIIDREKFDVVHAQGLCCRSADVITAHVCNAARYARAPARSLHKRLFPWLVIPREAAFYRQAVAAGSKVIAVSNVLKRELETEYQVPNATIIHHGVDTAKFAPVDDATRRKLREELCLPVGKWLWLFVGEAVKGLSETIRALRRFPEAHLVVVTRSPLGPWRRWAKVHFVTYPDQITFHGPALETDRFYQAADLFVYPSEYDTFGMVVAEAMACGLPVVAGQHIGAAEWIRHGENGYLCDPRDIQSLVAQIQSIEKRAPDRLKALRENARRTAEAQTWERCAERTMEVYKSSKRAKT